MKVLVPPISSRIDPADPFAGANSQRAQLATNLTRLLRASEDGLVLTIEGEWGSGKTSFLRMWKAQLSCEKDFIPVYYDAFAYDFTADPFVSLAAAIYGQLQGRVQQRKAAATAGAQLDHLKKVSKKLAIELTQMTAGLAVSSLSSGLFSSGAVREWLKRAFRRLSFDTLAVNAGEKFEAFLRSNDTIFNFRKSLEGLLCADEAGPSRIVVFVDELDRCRPLFAVELIEKVKHLFNIPKVFFVLGVNSRQLVSTIQTVYGVKEADSKVYLQKFVDFTTRLPVEIKAETDGKETQRLLEAACRLLGLDQDPRNILEDCESLAKLAGPLELCMSPRAVEKALSYVSLALHSCSDGDALRLKRVVPFGALVRVADEEVFQRFRRSGAVSDHGEVGKSCFTWAQVVFKGELKQIATNVFQVPGLQEAAKLIEMYEIPEAQGISAGGEGNGNGP